jgi:hypothetical protein
MNPAMTLYLDASDSDGESPLKCQQGRWIQAQNEDPLISQGDELGIGSINTLWPTETLFWSSLPLLTFVVVEPCCHAMAGVGESAQWSTRCMNQSTPLAHPAE